jgi:hypothetical protein
MAKAKIISWRHDGLNVDGTPIAEEAFRGWTLEVNGAATVSVPRGWWTDGQYSISTADMPVFSEAGRYAIQLALVTTGGTSDFTPVVSFELLESLPKPPFGLAVA